MNTVHLNQKGGILQLWGRNSRLFFASLMDKLSSLGGALSGKQTAGPVSILLADDDEDDRLLFTEAIMMIDPSIRVETASNGMELLRHVEKGFKPEIIFLDLNMPGKTGKECLEELRQDSRFGKIPVIIYSTSINKRDILETFNGGANLYLHKPASFRELINILRKAFSFDWDQHPVLNPNDFLLTSKK